MRGRGLVHSTTIYLTHNTARRIAHPRGRSARRGVRCQRHARVGLVPPLLMPSASPAAAPPLRSRKRRGRGCDDARRRQRMRVILRRGARGARGSRACINTLASASKVAGEVDREARHSATRDVEADAVRAGARRIGEHRPDLAPRAAAAQPGRA